MKLQIHSDASSLPAHQARSRVGGLFFLGNKDTSNESDMHGGRILLVRGTLKIIVSSAAEAEVGGLYANAREGDTIRTMLKEMGWEQKNPTPITIDNLTAEGIANNAVKRFRSKTIDMHNYWVHNRVTQQLFTILWATLHHSVGTQ